MEDFAALISKECGCEVSNNKVFSMIPEERRTFRSSGKNYTLECTTAQEAIEKPAQMSSEQWRSKRNNKGIKHLIIKRNK